MREVPYESLELNPFTAIGKDHFLLTAGTPSHWNTMTAGWAGMGYMWNRPSFFAYVRKSRYTMEFMEESKTFTASFFPPECENALKYCGTHSGRDVSKMASGLLEPLTLTENETGREFCTFKESNLVFAVTKCYVQAMAESCILSDKVKALYEDKDYHTLFLGFIDHIYIN